MHNHMTKLATLRKK